MKNWMKGAMMTGAMIVASPSFAATTVDLSGTVAAQASKTVSLNAGTYNVSLIKGAFTAVSVAGFGNGNYVDYYKYTINNVTKFWNPFEPSSPRFATADAAFAAYSANPQLSFTLAAATDVTFAIGDNLSQLGDNTGGTSLSISAVPEPATWLTMILGFGVLGGALRSASRGRRAVVAA